MKEVLDRAKACFTARKLRKVCDDAFIGGVCAGVAYWLGIPVWLTRLLWACASFYYGFGVGLYILLWIFMPEWEEAPEDYNEVTGD